MRLIDADTFNHFDYSCFDGQLSEDAIQGMDTVLNVIDTAPTIDAESVRHGHWIYDEEAYEDESYTCSCCGGHMVYSYDTCSVTYCENAYCPECGAKMDEPFADVGKKVDEVSE